MRLKNYDRTINVSCDPVLIAFYQGEDSIYNKEPNPYLYQPSHDDDMDISYLCYQAFRDGQFSERNFLTVVSSPSPKIS